jgi:hypothetical protein
MEFGPGQFGKWLILLGIIIVAFGVMLLLLGRLGFFRLPGDLHFGSKNWHIYLPITSCILISLLLTIILWIISYFRR